MLTPVENSKIFAEMLDSNKEDEALDFIKKNNIETDYIYKKKNLLKWIVEEFKNCEIIEELLKRGATIPDDLFNSYGNIDPLIIKLLLAYGANADKIYDHNKHGENGAYSFFCKLVDCLIYNDSLNPISKIIESRKDIDKNIMPYFKPDLLCKRADFFLKLFQKDKNAEELMAIRKNIETLQSTGDFLIKQVNKVIDEFIQGKIATIGASFTSEDDALKILESVETPLISAFYNGPFLAPHTGIEAFKKHSGQVNSDLLDLENSKIKSNSEKFFNKYPIYRVPGTFIRGANENVLLISIFNSQNDEIKNLLSSSVFDDTTKKKIKAVLFKYEKIKDIAPILVHYNQKIMNELSEIKHMLCDSDEIDSATPSFPEATNELKVVGEDT
jgi:hypothetical protein